MPTLTIFAGINGAGKSTLYNFISTQTDQKLGFRICPDEILQDFNGQWDKKRDQIKSGYIAIKQIRSCLETGRTFNWETTILTGFAVKVIKQAKAQGFTINLNFIGVENVQQSLDRIEKRVKQGGHGIPLELVLYRFNRQFDGLNEVLGLIDNAMFYDNSTNMEIVASYYNKTLLVFKDVNWINELDYLQYRKPPLLKFKLSDIKIEEFLTKRGK